MTESVDRTDLVNGDYTVEAEEDEDMTDPDSVNVECTKSVEPMTDSTYSADTDHLLPHDGHSSPHDGQSWWCS